MTWTRRHAFAWGIALVAATNAIALIGAAWNREGEPESTLRLSHRELRPPRAALASESSGLTLRLHWRVLQEDATSPGNFLWGGAGYAQSPSWLDRDKMASLGFDVSVPDNLYQRARNFGRQLARDVLLVLEADGATYRRSLQLAAAAAEQLRSRPGQGNDERASEILDRETRDNSRLFVVDAGLDAAALRAKYPDRSRYAIVRGKVEPAEFRHLSGAHRGLISALSIEEVHVPLDMRPVFAGAVPESDYEAQDARKVSYEVMLSFGRRLEPWIASAAGK